MGDFRTDLGASHHWASLYGTEIHEAGPQFTDRHFLFRNVAAVPEGPVYPRPDIRFAMADSRSAIGSETRSAGAWRPRPVDQRMQPLIKRSTSKKEFSMSTLASERPVVVVPSPTTTSAPLSHPTGCPQWCKDRGRPSEHHFGPSSTAHWSPQYVLPNPRPLYGQPVLMRAELSRLDDGDLLDRTVLFVQGETDIDLTPEEADAFIAQAQAWVDTLRVLRRQMA